MWGHFPGASVGRPGLLASAASRLDAPRCGGDTQHVALQLRYTRVIAMRLRQC